MSFVPIRRMLDGTYNGQYVGIRGWIYRRRESKDIIFIVVRDATGIIQCTIKKESLAWEKAKKSTIESSIELYGIAREDRRSPGGVEISTEKLTIIGLADVFPITKDQSEDFLRDVRHLWLRSRRMAAILRIRSEVLRFVHLAHRKKGFVEVSPPMFISTACEGGATLFGLKYFANRMYLTQSAQLYLEVLASSLEKIYCVAPSFRAEKSRTIRHLTEYWHIEAEQAFATIEDVMSFQEDLVSYVCQKVAEKCKMELKHLNINPQELLKITPPFERITYDDALIKLQDKGFNVRWGEDFGFNEEKELATEFGFPFFVYAYPRKIKAFYCKAYKDNPDLAMSVDLLVPRVGEIATGGSRIDKKEELIQNMKDFDLNPKDYDWYLDIRKYGSVPHAGFGLGLERLLMWMLNLEGVMDTIPFPRTPRRFYP